MSERGSTNHIETAQQLSTKRTQTHISQSEVKDETVKYLYPDTSAQIQKQTKSSEKLVTVLGNRCTMGKNMYQR